MVNPLVTILIEYGEKLINLFSHVISDILWEFLYTLVELQLCALEVHRELIQRQEGVVAGIKGLKDLLEVSCHHTWDVA